jgi:antitoxin HicB
MSNLDYAFNVRPLTTHDGGGYFIEYPQLPGCVSDGDTIAEAIRNGEDAVRSWIHAAKLHGDPVPKPKMASEPMTHNGKILSRVPRTLHARLVARAKEEGVSLNQLVLAFVAEGLGRRSAKWK